MTTPGPRLATAVAVALGLTPWFAASAQNSGTTSAASTPSTSAGAGAADPPSPGKVSGAASSGWWRHYPFYVTTVTPSGEVVTYVPPQFVGFGLRPLVVAPVPAPAPVFDPGPVAPSPPPGLIRPVQPVEKPRRADSSRANRLITLGDRMFRINDWKRAEDRYKQAARVDPGSATPRVRLAQVAIARERYGEAADRFREAETARPGWIATARDVQALYAEPADFADRIARIEAHLHAQPGDRDAWLVLGAQWFLSGREAQAADVFRRLDDPHRRPDVALAAFLDATNQPKARHEAPEPPGAAGRDPFRPPAERP